MHKGDELGAARLDRRLRRGIRLSLVLLLALVAGYSNALISRAEGKDPFQGLAIQVFRERPKAPDFELERTDGTKIRLSDLKGKVVLLNFFATWCTPCRFEMPEMQALYERFKNKAFEIVAISIDRSATPIKPFADSLNLSFLILHDPSQDVARKYGFRGPPLSYFIDRNGRVVGGAAGPRNWNHPLAHEIVKKLLAEPMSK